MWAEVVVRVLTSIRGTRGMNDLWKGFRVLLAFVVELGLKLGLLIDERLLRLLRFPIHQLIFMSCM